MKRAGLLTGIIAAIRQGSKALFASTPTEPSLAVIMERIRSKYHLPALAGAILTTDGVSDQAAVGLRKVGTTFPVSVNDLWHLGSCTKAMTALLAGTFVAEGKLAWDARVAAFFPESTARSSPMMRDVTVAQLLSHHAGLAENYPRDRARALAGSIMEQRLVVAEWLLQSPAYPPGSFHYSNGGYIVMGAILEKLGGASWEELMRERVFVPLHMPSAGFGGTGTVDEIDQPWPHFSDGRAAPSNGPRADNLPYMGPAGSVNCSLADWGKFLADQMRGGAGKQALLPAAIYQAMQAPAPGSSYGFGWNIVPRSWAGGNMLSHAGSNTMNHAACWLGPVRGYGVLVCSNQAGDDVACAANEVAEAMLRL